LAWFIAFISQCIATAQCQYSSLLFYACSYYFIPLVHEQSVGVGWFGIFLQLFLTLGVLHTLASDSIAMHRFQISVFGAIAIVMAVITVSNSIFTGRAALDAMAAGWLIIAIVDILWVIYFTSEEDSLAFHLFNSMGTGGLTPPSRRRRTRGASNIGTNGYAANYSPGGGIGSHDIPYDSANKMGGIGTGPGVRSQNSFVGGASMDGAPRSLGPAAGVGSVHSTPNPAQVSLSGPDNSMGPGSPLMGPGAAGVGAGGGTGGSPNMPEANPGGPEAYVYKAKALYACKSRAL
jgi:SHO1 osmosensor